MINRYEVLLAAVDGICISASPTEEVAEVEWTITQRLVSKTEDYEMEGSWGGSARSYRLELEKRGKEFLEKVGERNIQKLSKTFEMQTVREKIYLQSKMPGI